ncbi:hypothetical protein F5882DRAFT_446616 [Hyaloscypha sp. PMI_1271]|nr:hypothetical protein F5882DRAFT_446616 [Hyaloscypha sp. PMI_1271]
MDPFSATASGIAVVSLAIQLVDYVRQIQRFLRSVSEAPKELKRLIDLLEQLELILESIGALIDRQQRQSGSSATVSETVLRAMKACENTLERLESIVNAAKKASDAKNKAARSLGSFRLSCKKKDIEDFERQLHDAVSLLNLTMTTNLTVMHSESVGNLLTQVMATNQITTTINKELVLLRKDAENTGDRNQRDSSAITTSCNKSPKSTTRSRAMKTRSETFSSFNGPLGKVVIKNRSVNMTFEDDEEHSINTYTQNKSTWIFMPSFLSHCIDFRYLNTCGYIQRSLRTYPIISDGHLVWKMCKRGDIKGIQSLFSERQVSPFSINSSGRTLLHCSANNHRPELCRFLMNVGLTGQETDNYGAYAKPLLKVILRTPIDCYSTPHQMVGLIVKTEQELVELERTYDLLVLNVDDPDPIWCGRILFFECFEPSFHVFNQMVQKWVSTKPAKDLCNEAIFLAVRMLRKSNSIGLWKQAILSLLNLEPDLHNDFSGRPKTTFLDKVLNLVDRPFESISLGQKWLEILSESGIDLVQYLRAESEIHFNPSKALPMMEGYYMTACRDRYLVISEDPPAVSWNWYLEPTGTALDVLNEFKDFGVGPQYPNLNPFVEVEQVVFRDWPFFYPPWQAGILRGKWRTPEDESSLRHFNARCERRQQRKAMRLAKAQGLLHRGPKVPGAWVD